MEENKTPRLSRIASELVPSHVTAEIYHRTNSPLACTTIRPSFAISTDDSNNSSDEYIDEASTIEYAPSDCTIRGSIADSDENSPTSDDDQHRQSSESSHSPHCFRLETWYPKISMHTFPTVIIDLHYCEAKAIAKYFESYKRTMQLKRKQQHSIIDSYTLI